MRYENEALATKVNAIVEKLDDMHAQRNTLVTAARDLTNCEPADFEVYKKQISLILNVIEDLRFNLAVPLSEVI